MPHKEPSLQQMAEAPKIGAKAHPYGIAACAVSLLAVLVAAALLMSEGGAGHSADLRFVIPISALSVVLSGIALLRKEPGFALPAVAIACAGAALVLGWIVIVGLVALGTAIVIGILSYLM